MLLLLSPLLLALLLLKSEALVLELHFLELGLALLGHLVLQHAAHAVHREGLLCVGPIHTHKLPCYDLLFFLGLGVVVHVLLVFLFIDPLFLGV
jgi:hypothetical protein